MKLNKREDQSVDASVLLRRENKIITGARTSERMGRTQGVERKKRDRIRCDWRQRRSTEGQEIELRYVAVGDGELVIATRK